MNYQPMCLSVIVMLATLVSAQASELRRFEKDGLVIGVKALADASGEYQIAVNAGPRTLSRLSVNRAGRIGDVWLDDLDRDGRFEIIVTTFSLDTAAKGRVDVHEWHDFRFETIAAKHQAAALNEGYQGNDQYTVEDGRLIRSFPVFEPSADGKTLPSGVISRFEYRINEREWRRIE